MNSHPQSFEVIVVGGGPAGLACAIAFATANVPTALVARNLPYGDNRTTALLGRSVDWLQNLGIWENCAEDASPLRVMRLIDDTGRLIRAPEVRFDCHEIGLDAFGYNIENRKLVAAMEQRASQLAALTRFDAVAETILPDEDHISVALPANVTLRAKLVVGADGRQSASRIAAGITTRVTALPQTALTFNIAHSRPHRDISTEFHTADGPCVFVPLQGDRSSVVWVTSPMRAAELGTLDDTALCEAIERQAHSILGRVMLLPGRSTFPLGIEQADALARNRIALIGEAAHVVPPIGAQGLNLGLRDAQALAEIVAEARMANDDCGSPAISARYGSRRRADVTITRTAIETANRTLLSDFLPAQALRAVGLGALADIGPLRRFAMRAGLGETIPS
jgi:2-octaprenyl-6-methoxyphenol hydroxylase